MKENNDIEKLDEQIKILNEMIDNKPETIRNSDQDTIIEKLSSTTKRIQKIDELESVIYTDKNSFDNEEDTRKIEVFHEENSLGQNSNGSSSRVLNKIFLILAFVLFFLILFLLLF